MEQTDTNSNESLLKLAASGIQETSENIWTEPDTHEEHGSSSDAGTTLLASDLEMTESHYNAEEEVKAKAGEATPDVPEIETKESEQIQEQEQNELKSSLALWLQECKVDEDVINLIYWKSYTRSGVTFGGLLFILLTLQCYTFISTVTCFAMAVLIVAFIYRIGLTVTNAIQKTGSDHPFKELLESEFEISDETVAWFTSKLRCVLVTRVNWLKRLFLIDNITESLKFGVVLWFISYMGALLSLVTMATVVCVMIFTLPKVYEDYQVQVDKFIETSATKMNSTIERLASKLPANLSVKHKPE